MLTLLSMALLLQSGCAFHIPHAGHQNPLYVRYRQEHLEQQHKHSQSNARHGPHSQVPCPSDIVKTQGSVKAISEEQDIRLGATNLDAPLPLDNAFANVVPDISISTPVSYDEETGMVQTAVRAIVRHPVSSLVDNDLVGISSTVVLATGALTEVAHCMQLEVTHHAAAGSTEGLAILSMGHFFHYGREAIKQLMELSEETKEHKEEVDEVPTPHVSV